MLLPEPALEPIKEAPSDSPLTQHASEEPTDCSKTPEVATIAVIEEDSDRKRGYKMLYVLEVLDKLQSKTFEYVWVTILYVNILFPPLIARYVLSTHERPRGNSILTIKLKNRRRSSGSCIACSISWSK